MWEGGVRENFGWKIVLAFSGFFYFFQKQKLNETRLMKELITDFNNRYDKLNERLNDIRRKGDEDPSMVLDQNDRTTLDDYFNLCAEEHLFNDLGYIDPQVWKAWDNGMRIYARDRRIREYWEQELETDSYYGFSLPKQQTE